MFSKSSFKLLTLIIIFSFFTSTLQAIVTFDDSKKYEKLKKEKRLALVIGNSDYKYLKKLKYSMQSSKDMLRALEKKGFNVIYLQDVSLEKMKKAILDFSLEVEKNRAVGLFYYAGHTNQIKGENYLLPIDTNTTKDKKTNLLSVNFILSNLQKAKNRLNILLFDSYEEMANEKYGEYDNVDIAYPCKIKESDERIFTKTLINFMDVEGLSMEHFLNRVLQELKENAKKELCIKYSNIKDFFFTLPKNNIYKSSNINKSSVQHGLALNNDIPNDKFNQKEYIKVKVFYGTNRQKDNSEINYNSNRVKKINYGIADVTIPKTHKIGELEKPKWYLLEFSENPKKHISIQKVTPLSENNFFIRARDDIRSDSNQTLIFIHGYNVNFNTALKRTAQIAYDLNFQGLPIAFSWPSKGTLSGYSSDEETVRLSVRYLKEFLIDVREKIGTKKFHIIAHSMGNRVLVNALKELNKKLDINQIILASPDINSEIFKEEIAPKIVNKAQNITIYVSDFDKALSASKKVHSYPSVGLSSDGIIEVKGMDIINASNIKAGDLLGHSFFINTKEIINDIFYIIRENYTPKQRNLIKNRHYWIFEK